MELETQMSGHCLLSNNSFKSKTELDQSGNLDKVNADHKIRAITCKPDEFEEVYEKYRSELAKFDIEKVLAERAEHFGPQ